MPGSIYGNLFRVTTWGESHGKAVGAVVDGCPAGLSLCEADIQAYLNRRKPGQSRFTTARAEGDQVEILSGVFEGRTTGTPISMRMNFSPVAFSNKLAIFTMSRMEASSKLLAPHCAMVESTNCLSIKLCCMTIVWFCYLHFETILRDKIEKTKGLNLFNL